MSIIPSTDGAKRRSQWLTVKAVVWAFLLLVVLPGVIMGAFNTWIYVNRVEAEITGVKDGCYLSLEWRHRDKIYAPKAPRRFERRFVSCDAIEAFRATHRDWWSEGGDEKASISRTGTFRDYTLWVPFEAGGVERMERRYDDDQTDFLGRRTVFVRALEWPTQDILSVNGSRLIFEPIQFLIVGFTAVLGCIGIVNLGVQSTADQFIDSVERHERRERFRETGGSVVAIAFLALFALLMFSWMRSIIKVLF